jgi:N4-gp56 family major capsid protein
MSNVISQRTTISNLIQTAYDKLVEFNLRSEPMFRKFADKRPVDVTNPGGTVMFQLHNDLDRVTTTLTEENDVDAVGIKNTNRVSVTVDEWGNAVQRTERLALESLSAIDPAIADMIAFNMMDSLDYQVFLKLVNPAVSRFSGTNAADETVVNGEDLIKETADKLGAASVRKAVAKLRGAKVQPRDGQFYVGMLSPDVSYDLRTEAAGSGANVWQMPHTYTEGGVGNMWTGEVGIYEGVKFIESPRVEKALGAARTITNKALSGNVATLTSNGHGFKQGDEVTVAGVDAVFNGTFTITAADANTFSYAKTNANVTSASVSDAEAIARIDEHKAIILGKQALVEAVTYEPKTVVGPVIDKLARFRTIGWKGLLGWNIYRPEARYVVSVRSSI